MKTHRSTISLHAHAPYIYSNLT